MSKLTTYVAMPIGVALAVVTGLAAPANAASSDSDRDGMSNAFEIKYKLNYRSAADAKVDADKDGLSNLAEFKLKANPRDEDTDNDGQDDGDELKSKTKVTVADTDRDGILDGDEDANHNGIANEDEDDALEVCAADDDDRDKDHVDDEDENELKLVVGSRDSNRNGVVDGDEDRDRDGVSNEDEDDVVKTAAVKDRCSDDDEDEGDLFGTITSFTPAVPVVAGTGTLVVKNVAGAMVTFLVTVNTEIEFDEHGSRGEDAADATVADLKAGALIAELEIQRSTGALHEIKLV